MSSAVIGVEGEGEIKYKYVLFPFSSFFSSAYDDDGKGYFKYMYVCRNRHRAGGPGAWNVGSIPQNAFKCSTTWIVTVFVTGYSDKYQIIRLFGQ